MFRLAFLILALAAGQPGVFAQARTVNYDFSTQTEYWTYAGGWGLRDNGIGGSLAAWGFNLVEDDYLASPALYLLAGRSILSRSG